MGIVIDASSANNRELFRLVIDCSGNQCHDAVSVSKAIAEKLAEISSIRMRSIQLESCFSQVISQLSPGSIICDIDVLFNPDYQVDVLNVLINTFKKYPYRLIWPGKCEDGQLEYAEDGYTDHKVYTIADYDIVCIK